MSRRMLVAMGAAMALALIVCGAAFAAEVSRDEFKAAAEPICKTNTQANERILAGVRKEVKQGKLKTAAAKFTKAASALKAAIRELEAVPRPSADEARLAKWFTLLKGQAELFTTAAKELKSGDKVSASRDVVKLTQNANKANLEVLPFGFRYCRLEPAKFT